MAKNLLIVESPAKAKTIEKYLGKDFEVKSSFGHVRDLGKENMGIDFDKKFKPVYIVSPDKKKVVKELKAKAKKADHIWLATDEDREGEAISWHLCEVLGLDIDTTKRIVFREITKPAILAAVDNPRTVDMDVVNAQQARRVLDRLVGFELSQTLWRKVKTNLSAGRVQSVTLRLVVEREREINAFQPESFFKLLTFFNVDSKNGKQAILKAELPNRMKVESDANKFLTDCKNANFTIKDLKAKRHKRNPAPPFTTSTLQQDASRKFGFSVRRTMSTAQRLYEQGLISYMRTDSVSLSQTALDGIAEEIKKDYGEKYLHTRQFKTKDSGAQEAHEAIRPTAFDRKSAGKDSDQQKVYELIWKRAIASQMSPAELEKTTAEISISTRPEILKATGEVVVFDGFLKLYMASTDDEEADKGMLPPLSVGQVLDLDYMESKQRFTKPPARYTEASLVKKMEEIGVGRPSTYAPTIGRLMDEKRGYISKEQREGKERKFVTLKLEDGKIDKVEQMENYGANRNRLIPSDIGMLVTKFLGDNFEEIVDYKFTADVENQLDKIASGKVEWADVISDFYGPFHKHVEDALAKTGKEKGRRDLGKHPKTGHTVLVQMSRFGPVAQIGTVEEVGEEGKPIFASLKPGQSIETINFDEVMELFKLPKTLGEFEGKEVVIASGRFGPYIKYNELYISIPRGEDPLDLKLERAHELIKEKLIEIAPIGTYKGIDYTKGKGRFGPFLKYDGLFVNIPKRFDPDNITVEECHELIEAKLVKEANRYIHRWESEKLAVENGRWGPFIRFKKKSIKLPKVKDMRMTPEQAAKLTLEDVKKLVKAEIPSAFKAKKKKAKKVTKNK